MNTTQRGMSFDRTMKSHTEQWGYRVASLSRVYESQKSRGSHSLKQLLSLAFTPIDERRRTRGLLLIFTSDCSLCFLIPSSFFSLWPSVRTVTLVPICTLIGSEARFAFLIQKELPLVCLCYYKEGIKMLLRWLRVDSERRSGS